MKKFRIIITFICLIVLFTGCEKNKESKTTERKTTATTSNSTPTYEEGDEDPVLFAEANYFQREIEELTYYKQGKKYTFSSDSKEGKEILSCVKKGFFILMNLCRIKMF